MSRRKLFAVLMLGVQAVQFNVRAEEASEQVATTQADAAATTDEDQRPAQKTERVEVIGSHIKRIDTEGASPVVTVTRKELEATGHNSVADVLRDSTSSSFGGLREASGSNAAGNAQVDLRGLGSTNTLVLLNGQRMPTDAVTGAVDLNMIPMAAIERVEILKDGASALYGSDALGGVINIVTRKDFSGTQASVQQTLSDLGGGAKSELSLVNGINTESLNVVNVLQYRDNKTVFSRERDWTNKGVSNIGSPGSYRNTGGTWQADPNCPAERLVTTPAGTFCSFKYSDYSTELPAIQQLSVMSEARTELSSRVRLLTRIGGTQRKVQWSYAASPGNFMIPGSVADTLGPGGTPLPGTTAGQDLNVRFRLAELGTRDADVTTYGYNALLGTEIDLGRDWELNVSGSHNAIRSSDKGVNGYALTSELNKAIESGAFNPFAPEGQRGSLSSARYVPEEKTTSLITSANSIVRGSLAELSSGELGLAVGTTFTHQKYEDIFDEKSVNGEVFGNAGSSGGGERTTQALFSEVSIPVLSNLEMQIAGRYDRYSDFGSTANPKASLSYRPTQNVLLRASAGTGFKAPLMQDMYAASGLGYPTFVDHVACKSEQAAGGATPSCLPGQYEVKSGGNTGLKEEKSLSYNMGAVVQPTRGLTISGDWFQTKVTNVVGIDYSEAMLAESMGIDLSKHGVIVERDSNGYLVSMYAPMQNLASQQVQGVDIGVSYQISRWKLGVDHSHLIHFKQEGFPGTGLKDVLGGNGRPAWRNTISVGVTPAFRHDLTLSAITIGNHKKAVEDAGGDLPAHTTIDVDYVYKTAGLGDITLGIRNLFATNPPLDDTNPTRPLDTTLYDQIGRQYRVGYRLTF